MLRGLEREGVYRRLLRLQRGFYLLIRWFGRQGNKVPQDTPSARGKRAVPVRGVGNKTEYSDQLTSLLASNDFRDRMKGIDQLVADCQHNPNMVINTIFPVGATAVPLRRAALSNAARLFPPVQVFDAFKDRLLESNSKVNLHALESLPKITSVLKNDMSRVVNILFPAIVDSHLNSKNNAVYSAAVGAINALVLHLGLYLHARLQPQLIRLSLLMRCS